MTTQKMKRLVASDARLSAVAGLLRRAAAAVASAVAETPAAPTKRPAEGGERPTRREQQGRAPSEIVPRRRSGTSATTRAPTSRRRCKRYAAAKKSGGLLGLGVPQRRRAPSRTPPTRTRACSRRASTRAPCYTSAAARTTPSTDLGGHDQVRPGHRQPRLRRLEERRHAARPSRCSTRAIEVDPLHTVEARNNLAQILRDKARRAERATRRSSTSARPSATCAPCWRSTATTCRRSRRWRSSTTT